MAQVFSYSLSDSHQEVQSKILKHRKLSSTIIIRQDLSEYFLRSLKCTVHEILINFLFAKKINSSPWSFQFSFQISTFHHMLFCRKCPYVIPTTLFHKRFVSSARASHLTVFVVHNRALTLTCLLGFITRSSYPSSHSFVLFLCTFTKLGANSFRYLITFHKIKIFPTNRSIWLLYFMWMYI